MGQELKIEFIEHSKLIFSSSVLHYALKFSTRNEFSSFKVHFSAAC